MYFNYDGCLICVDICATQPLQHEPLDQQALEELTGLSMKIVKMNHALKCALRKQNALIEFMTKEQESLKHIVQKLEYDALVKDCDLIMSKDTSRVERVIRSARKKILSLSDFVDVEDVLEEMDSLLPEQEANMIRSVETIPPFVAEGPSEKEQALKLDDAISWLRFDVENELRTMGLTLKDKQSS
jgi:hypothetical protein